MQGKVTVQEVCKSYGSFLALDNISFEIAPGEFLTLLGPSGSGKTTLLNVLAGFVRPDSGSLEVDGREFVTLPPHKRNIGMVFQNYALFPHMSVRGNVGYPLKLRGVAGEALANRVKAVLESVQMEHLVDRKIDELSGGQRQRVALARAIVFEPSILLMDEPLSALDKKLREHMQIELKRLHRRLGMTTVYVTHDQREALTLSDRIAVIDQGRVVQLDVPSALYDRPVNKFVAGFIGEMSLLPVDLRPSGPELYGRKLMTRDAWTGNGSRLWLVVRPERLRWSSGDSSRCNCIEGTATDVIYQGDSYLITVRLPDGAQIEVRRVPDGDDALPERNGPVRLWLDRDHTILVGNQ
jgi:putative spermidine/putrescine transport system ATP-binding protein